MAVKDTKFTLSEVGSSTQETLRGDFTVKLTLSYADRLRRDQLRRELLGSQSPDHASQEALYLSGALAEVQVRLVEAPGWWKDSRNGLDLVDENIIVALYQKITELESEYQESIKKKGAEAAADLRQDAAKP